MIEQFLKDLERRIDPGVEDSLFEQWRLFADGRLGEGIFSPQRSKRVPPLDGCAVHWSMLHRGRIMIRDDAATNLSPAMFEEFVRPYDQRLLDTFAGGGIHFCGRGDHFISHAARLPGVFAINVTQPHLNDVETIFESTIDRGVQLLGFDRQIAEQALGRGRNLRGNVHCW